jgi:hypothetical protein
LLQVVQLPPPIKHHNPNPPLKWEIVSAVVMHI